MKECKHRWIEPPWGTGRESYRRAPNFMFYCYRCHECRFVALIGSST